MIELHDLRVTFLALTLGQGGAERQLYYMLRALREQRVDVRLLSLTRGEYWEEPIRELGVPVTWVGRRPSRLGRLLRILAELRRDRPAILQSQHLFVNSYVAIAGRLLGINEIGAIRSDGVTGVEQIGRVAAYLTFHGPRLLAANSVLAIDNVIAQGIPRQRLYLLPNVVNTERFRPGARAATGSFRLLAVGRLAKPKRFDRFLSILSRVRQHVAVPIRGLIAGEGPLRVELEAQALQLGLLPDAVEFLGRVDDVEGVYRDADVFLLTSDWEGTPNVLLEAMSSGLPSVVTAVGGIPDVVKPERTGFLVAPEDEEAMVAHVLHLINDADLRVKMGSAARRHIVDNYSLERLPTLLAELYTRVLPHKQTTDGSYA